MYDKTVLHNLKFRWLQFDNDLDFWIDEFILIDISTAGFGNYEGKYIYIHQSKRINIFLFVYFSVSKC